MGRTKTGVETGTEAAIRCALGTMAADRHLPRTASKLAELAGIGRATLYRAFEARPEVRDTFEKLLDQSPTKERSKLEGDLAGRLAEIGILKSRLAALTSTVEYLQRDNHALRQTLTHLGGVANIEGRTRRKEFE